MKKIIVTGADGQMGQALQAIAHQYSTIEFVFLMSNTLDISSYANCIAVFEKYNPDVCLNFAAYTNVEMAEEQQEKAYQVNATGCEHLAKVCLKFGTILAHISTDFVFDGKKSEPYVISDSPNPINVYGASKLKGEQYIQEIIDRFYIVRTSWVYSDFGHNFKNTMLKLAQTRNEVNVVNDQIGCPTEAIDVCKFVMKLIEEDNPFGLYHFSGDWICSWYEFAKAIFKQNNISIKVNAISSLEYPTKANRPKYSVLSKTTLINKEDFD